MGHSIQDPQLETMKDKVETKLPPALKEPVERTVLAGMKLLYSPDTHQKLVQPVYDALQKNGFQPEQIANGMVNFLGTLYKASNKGMKVEAAFPAGMILLAYVLDDLEQTKGLKVTPDMLKQIGTAMAKGFVKGFGLQNADAQPGAPNPASSEPQGLAGTVPPQPTPPPTQGAM